MLCSYFAIFRELSASLINSLALFKITFKGVIYSCEKLISTAS